MCFPFLEVTKTMFLSIVFLVYPSMRKRPAPKSLIPPSHLTTDTHSFFPVNKCTFLADKRYDTKEIYQQEGELALPRGMYHPIKQTQYQKLLPKEIPSVKLVLRCGRRINFLIMTVLVRNSVVH